VGDDPRPAGLGTREDAEPTTMVAVEDEHAVQVLDPETYEAKTIARPDYMGPRRRGGTGSQIAPGLHVLPESTGEDAD